MDDEPAFGNPADLRRLIVVMVAPWVIGATAFALALSARAAYRRGLLGDWVDGPFLVTFYGLGLVAILWLPGAWLLGVWRLVWRPGYRRSWYGWLWLLLMWTDLCFLMPVLELFMR